MNFLQFWYIRDMELGRVITMPTLNLMVRMIIGTDLMIKLLNSRTLTMLWS